MVLKHVGRAPQLQETTYTLPHREYECASIMTFVQGSNTMNASAFISLSTASALTIIVDTTSKSYAFGGHFLVVRSTLLPPAGGRQIAYDPILLLTGRDPLCPMLSRAQVHDSSHSRHDSPLFLTLFPLVSTSLLSDHGNY